MKAEATIILTSDAAYILKVAPDTVRYLERTGRLPALKTSRGVRLFNKEDVERLARQREARSHAPRAI